MLDVRRRKFLTLLGGAAAWPLAARAQQQKLPTIGVLGTASALAWSTWTDSFVQRLRALGWIEGRTVAIEYRWADGRSDRFAEIATEFVRLKVDVVLTSGAAGFAAKRATSTIPIVSAILPDPVRSGLVASLARPGGNLTGLSIQLSDLVGKRLELLGEIVTFIEVVVVRNGNTPTAGSTTGWVVHLNFGKSEFRQPSNFVISGSSSLKRIVHAEMDKCHADDPVEVMPQALVWLEQRAVAAARAEAKTMVQTEIKNMLRRMIGP